MTNNELNRMKQLMKYGLNENKKQPYSGIEYQKVAADGKLYGIVREGTKYYIKVSSKKENPLTENFEYIGGFRNRKDHEYTSFANAQKNFDLKMMSLSEAYGKGEHIVVESWNPDKQEELTVEATDKMKKEISRERQIMENTMKIFNRKPQSAVKPINEAKNECGAPFCEPADKEYKVKDNIKGAPEKGGKAEDANDHEKVDLKKTDIKENEQVLGWNRNDDYMDKSHGTEIGDSQPFDAAEGRNIDDGDKKVTNTGDEENGTIHEEKSMIDSEDNQNSPKPGVGPVGDNEPFDGEKGKQIDEAIDDIDDDSALTDDIDAGIEDDSLEGEPGLDAGEDLALDGEEALDDAEGEDIELGAEDAGIEERLTALEDKLDQILAAISEEDYEDDDLYDEEGADDFGPDEEEPIEDTIAFESKAYKAYKLRESAKKGNKKINEDGMKPFNDGERVPEGNMNKLDDFGKHPAYQKKVMELPPKDMKEFPGYYDMNDDSVKSDAPYGEKIGDGTPFEINPEAIDNAIAESINRFLKKNV